VYIQSVLALSIRVHSNSNVKPQIPPLPLGRLNVYTKSKVIDGNLNTQTTCILDLIYSCKTDL